MLTSGERTAAVARLRRLVATALDRRGLIAPGSLVVVGCSGGPDSSVLLDVLARLAPPRRLQLVVVHVDHQLRPGSGDDAVYVSGLGERYGLPVEIMRVRVERRASLQDAARRARHAALREAARQHCATAIALGHTADDQAETVLMRALTGSTPRSLSAMRERDGILVRPLLHAWRADIAAYVGARGLTPIDDPSNRDPRHTRTRVRHELLPALEQVFPGARRRLVVLAEQQQRLLEAGSRASAPSPPPARRPPARALPTAQPGVAAEPDARLRRV